MADMAKMEDWLGTIPSPQTRKSYRNGIKKFEEFNQKPIETLLDLDSKATGKIIDKFFVWLKDNGYSQNSRRNLTNAPIQYLKYFDIDPKYNKNLGIYKTTLTTRDHLLQVDEAKEMWKIASLEEKIMIKSWLLGLRIGDACRLEWKQFDFKPSDEPQEILIPTRKEGIVAHTFIDTEFQKYLEKYIPNLDQSNKYLFPSEKGGHVKEKQLLRRLQSLQRKAGIDAKGKVFGWHIARKLFLRTSSELGITSWNAQLMCGKSVDKSIATYINGVQLKNDAKKVHKVLAMETPNHEANSQIEDLKNALQEIEKENRISKTRIDNMQTSIEQQNQQIEDQQFDIKALEKVLLRALEVQGKPHEVIIKMRKKHLQEMSETTGAMSVEKEKVTYYLPQPDDSIKTIEEPYKEYELRGKQPTEEILKNKTQFNKARAGLIADNESEETESLFW